MILRKKFYHWICKILFLLLFSGINSVLSSAQSIDQQPSFWDAYTIRNLGVDDGITSQQIYKIHPDRRGYYWLISNRQLLRYDGLMVKNFEKGNLGGTLYDMVEDSKGDLWIPSIGRGLYKFNGDSLVNFEHLSGDLVKGIHLDHNDSLYLGTYGNGLKVMYEDSIVTSYTTDNGLVGNEIWIIESDKEERMWIGTNSGLSVLENGSFTNYTTQNGLPSSKIRAIKVMSNGDVWVGTDEEGIVIFRNEQPVQYINKAHGLPSLIVSSFEETPDGAILIGLLDAGVIKYENGKMDQLTQSDGIISDDINTIKLAKNGLIFIGTEDGLSVLVPKIFNSLSLDGKELFKDEAVTLNQDGSGKIWLGTYGNGYRYWEDGKWFSVESPPVATNGYAQSGTIDLKGNLWVGTQGSGVFEVIDNTFNQRFSTENGLFDDYVRGLTFDLDGNIWIGSNKGISVYDASHNLIQTYSKESEIPNAFCITMITASDGSVWYGSYGGGAVRFKNGVTTVYNEEKGLRSNQVLSIYEDSNNDVWIGTFNRGISKVVGDSLFTLSPEDGLPRSNYAGIIEDNSKNLWFATGNGILKMSMDAISNYQKDKTEGLPFHFFNIEDGLISDNLQAANNSTVSKLDDGTLLFASIDGVSFIHPEKEQLNTYPFEPYIDEIYVEDRIIYDIDNLRLNPSEKKLSISFSAINLIAPKKTEFRTKLSGIDKDWNYIGNRTTSYYDYLPDGTYTFTVSAIGPDGQWNDNTATISFTVLPPFYKTLWFRIICLLVFGGLIAGAVQIRSNIKLKELNRELALQRRIHKERERISRDLHDNVGSQITNLITGLEISNLHIKKNEPNKALSLIENLDVDARGAMTDLRETIWLLDKEEVEFGMFLDHLKGYIKRQSTYLKGLKVEINSEVDSEKILNPTLSLNLTRIIQEALNNARKYAQASLFEISFSNQEPNLLVKLVDDGIGMDISEKKKTGNGLQNMEDRAKEIHGTFKIESKPNMGTLIEVKV